MRAKPNSFVRTAVIAGHPGESEADFNELKEFLQTFDFDRVSVFEYSNEENTAAFKMAQIPKEVIRKRADILGEIAKAKMQNSLEKMLNKEIEVAIDGPSSEHEYLLSARPLLWAPEIDGEVLINDQNDLDVKVGEFYKAEVTQIAFPYALATLKEKVE